MSTEKIISLAKKLHALALNGIGGEKENAAAMLDRLMKQHSITFDMLEGIEKKEYTFLIELENKKFFYQICASVLGNNYDAYIYKKERSKKRTIKVVCTAADAVEIEAKYDFYLKAWQSDLEVFYSAFIQKNHIYRKETDEEREQRMANEKELTPEELDDLMKQRDLMRAMNKHHFAKQIKH